MEQFRLRIFEAVWTTGSYTKAARRLGITQPAVSQNIAELEREIGTTLFTRVAGVPSTCDAASGEEGSVGGLVRESSGCGSSDGSQTGSVKGGRMLPTPAAEIFMRLVKKVLKDYEDIRTLFNPETSSYKTVRIRADRSATEHVLTKVLDVLKTAHPNVDFEVLPADNESDDADVVISTVAIEQRDGVLLHFEVFGSATPFVEAVRLIISDF